MTNSKWSDLLGRQVDEAEAYSAISALQFATELITLINEQVAEQRERDYESGRKWLLSAGEC
jgi:hypothetical protein